MSKIIDSIIEKAKRLQKTVVLAEGEEPRTVEAAQTIVRNKIAKVVLLGDEEKLKTMYPYADFSGIKIINPLTADIEDYANTLYELRKAKGMSEEDARKEIRKYLNFGAMMIKKATRTVWLPER